MIIQKLGVDLLSATNASELAGVVGEPVYLDFAGVRGAEPWFGVAMLRVYNATQGSRAFKGADIG